MNLLWFEELCFVKKLTISPCTTPDQLCLQVIPAQAPLTHVLLSMWRSGDLASCLATVDQLHTRTALRVQVEAYPFFKSFYRRLYHDSEQVYVAELAKAYPDLHSVYSYAFSAHQKLFTFTHRLESKKIVTFLIT